MTRAWLFALLLFAGCSDGPARVDPPDDKGAPGSFWTTTVDGRECVIWQNGRAGGLSCDWNSR